MTTAFEYDPHPTIRSIVGDQEVVDWRQLSKCFEALRGQGFGYHTLQSWMARGMPGMVVVGRKALGLRRKYQPETVWAWYLQEFGDLEAAG